MHVRQEGDYFRVTPEFELGVNLIITIPGWNLELAIGGSQRKDALFWRFIRKHQPDAGPVRLVFSVRRVVHLEDDVGTRLDQPGLARLHDLRNHSRREAYQEVALPAVATLLRHKRDAGLSIFHPLRSRSAHKSNH